MNQGASLVLQVQLKYMISLHMVYLRFEESSLYIQQQTLYASAIMSLYAAGWL